MSKFKIGDRVKFHMEGRDHLDDVGTVCLGMCQLEDGYTWVHWDYDGEIVSAGDEFLTLIEPSRTQELLSSFKIDVQAYADENNISLEQAHNEIQPWLFENEFTWSSLNNTGRLVRCIGNPYLFCDKHNITHGNVSYYFNVQSTHKQIFLSRNVSVSLSVKEEEIVEIMGKKYRKGDVENALKNIEEKE